MHLQLHAQRAPLSRARLQGQERPECVSRVQEHAQGGDQLLAAILQDQHTQVAHVRALQAGGHQTPPGQSARHPLAGRRKQLLTILTNIQVCICSIFL